MQPVGVLLIDEGASHADHARGRPIDALEHIANRPIAQLVIDEFERVGVSEVVVIVPSELVDEVRAELDSEERAAGVRLHFVAPDEPGNLPATLRLAARVVGDAPCVIHPASGLLGAPLIHLAGLLTGDAPDVLVVTHPELSGSPKDRRSDQRILRLVENVPTDRAAVDAGGVWLCGPTALSCLVEQPRGEPGDLDLRRVAELVGAAGGECSVRLMAEWSRYAGNPADLLELNRMALDRLAADVHHVGGEGNRIEGRVRIDTRAVVQRSVLVGPVVIGPGARISDAYIGPYTSIGAGVQIEGAEIERSIVQSGASIAHIGVRLMSSVVGRHAKVFRDFSLPRAIRLRVGEGTEIGLC